MKTYNLKIKSKDQFDWELNIKIFLMYRIYIFINYFNSLIIKILSCYYDRFTFQMYHLLSGFNLKGFDLTLLFSFYYLDYMNLIKCFNLA